MTNSIDTQPIDNCDYQMEESVGYLLARARLCMSNLITQRSMTELGVTSQQGSILLMVASGKCSLASEVAREFGIDAGAVTRLIDRLESRGLLERVRSREDRRAIRLAVTPRGRDIAAQMPAIFISVFDNLLLGISGEEVSFLKSLLRRILANSSQFAACPDCQ
jgi:DNA-binding MarR family transcriptional regulator